MKHVILGHDSQSDGEASGVPPMEAQSLHLQRLKSISTLIHHSAQDLEHLFAQILANLATANESVTDPSTRKTLSDIKSDVNRGVAIIKQFLTLARDAAGCRAVLQPNDLIQVIVEILGEAFPKGIRIKTSCDSAVHEIEGDAMELHQVLLNLCANARDAMPDGGALTISSRNVELTDPVSCAGLFGKSGNYVKIQVADTGVGIPEELREKIFQPFFTTKNPGAGAGVGLSSVVRILKNHSALLDLESPPGNGATFSIYFPARLPQCQREIFAASANQPVNKQPLVMLVDDETDICEMCKMILECYDYRALTAENGMEALSLLDEHKHELSAVVVDMRMPLMDGPATIRAMRAVVPGLKFIATSGLSDGEQTAAFGDSAPDMYLKKPYSADQLVAALGKLLA